MKAVYARFGRECAVEVIETRVRVDNEPSNALERSLGAREISRDGEYIYYETRI